MSKTETKPTALERYKNTYSYKSLIQKHKLTETGLWKVRGEDPNCDFGGSHHMPDLGTYEGKLEDIIAYAVTLPSFWQWGAGGDITKVGLPIKITADSSAKRVAAEQKVKALEAQLKAAREELKGL